MNLGLLTSVSKLFKENVSLCIICVGFQPTSNYPLRSNYCQTLWKWECMSSNGRHTLGKLIEALYILRPFYIKFVWGLFICWGLFLQKNFLRGLFLRSLFTYTHTLKSLSSSLIKYWPRTLFKEIRYLVFPVGILWNFLKIL